MRVTALLFDPPMHAPYHRLKAEDLSFLHVLLVWGVKLVSLLNKQADSGCATEAVNSRQVSRYHSRFYKVGVDNINGRY
jgi:hypothetical protein